ncbi:DUF4258 domain-containing protein [Desulfofundulus thermobenzoicus]|uniref:DUF4258 domain-containing protein n=1 Tax=Desulfofundulus thermobenzoicus TaxID=29376 RepID=A0A6N7INW9_9FIRM|nr:DUF4258 domain-containing protein [Desulfofundulus thermobenzoicus]MQL51630.1 DUF4258 domain-containing protein [Desulfofundulus thermobenzoicus]
MSIRYTYHAQKQMLERGISKALVDETIVNPDQMVSQAEGIFILQKIYREREKDYLLRVAVKFEADISVVLTVYRTSKIRKYWRGDR